MQANPGRVPPRPCNTAAGLGGCMGESMSTGAETLLHQMIVSIHKILCFPLLCHIAVEDPLLDAPPCNPRPRLATEQSTPPC